jgi:peptide chain release factor 1
LDTVQRGADMKKELLFSITKKDFKIEYFSGTGAGGQYRNKHQNCVRIHHPESGVVVTGQSNRERISNLREAFKNMVNDPKFKVWHNRKIQEILSGKNIETIVEKQMSPENIKVEIKENEKWVESV